MRFHNPLDDILGNPVRLAVLRVLAHSPAQGFTGRELARICHFSPSQTILALQSLEESGILTRQVAGPSHVWMLASQHWFSDHLVKLFEKERQSMGVLKSELLAAVARLPVTRALIFGSIAREEERPSSDIDLFVQVRGKEEKLRTEDVLSAFSPKFAVKFGNPLSSLVMTNDQVSRSSNPRLIEEILNEGQSVIP